MNRLVMLLFTVCVMFVVEGSMEKIFKVKREASLGSRLLHGQTDGGKIKVYVETLVVVDKTVRDKFKSDKEAKHYAEILLSLASDIFQHESLTQHGLEIHIIPSKVHIDKQNLKLNATNGRRNLYTACRHMRNIEERQSKKFDTKLFLTRTLFGAAGYTVKESMCSRNRSGCSIVIDDGFHAAFTIAHEISHTIGLGHVAYRGYFRYIMSSYKDSRFNNHRWSNESQSTMIRNIKKYRDYCLGNKPTIPIQRYQYPGVYFSFQRQCELEFGDDFTAWQPGMRGDPCVELQCNMPGKWSFLRKSTGSPALDGTQCGENKYCLSGKCQEKPRDEIENQFIV